MTGDSGIRVGRRRGYTMVYNDLLPPDGKMSARAWGLYVYLIGRPEGWETRVSHLRTVFREGRDALYAALGELVEHGLMIREHYSEGGLRRTRYAIPDDFDASPARRPGPDSQDSDNPDAGSPGPDSQEPGDPDAGSPDPENAGQASTEVATTEVATTGETLFVADATEPDPEPQPDPLSDEALTVEFTAWYADYPRKIGRHAAWLKYRAARRNGAPAEVLFAALIAQLPTLLSKDTKYRPHPATWLNQQRWLDDYEAPEQPDGPSNVHRLPVSDPEHQRLANIWDGKA